MIVRMVSSLQWQCAANVSSASRTNSPCALRDTPAAPVHQAAPGHDVPARLASPANRTLHCREMKNPPSGLAGIIVREIPQSFTSSVASLVSAHAGTTYKKPFRPANVPSPCPPLYPHLTPVIVQRCPQHRTLHQKQNPAFGFFSQKRGFLVVPRTGFEPVLPA